MSESLTFRLLTYVRAVAEARNFTRAAERLYLSQPLLSQQVRDLEEQLKFPLFHRKGPGIRVTDAGKLIVSYADRALQKRDEIVAIARAIHLGNVSPLRLGFSSFINVGLLQCFREQYESMFPGCEIHLAGVEPMLALQSLRERLLHCAFLPMPIDDEILKVQQIARSALVVCMPSSDPLAGQSRVEMNEVAERLRIFRDPELHPAAHARLVEMFQEVGVRLIIYSSARTSTNMNGS